MPSSHLRMEEATAIIASKSIADGYERSDVSDDLDDLVLQIDENEINNELRANGLVEDLAIDVLKIKNKDDEENIDKPQKEQSKTCLHEQRGEENGCQIDDLCRPVNKPKEDQDQSDIVKQKDFSKHKKETMMTGKSDEKSPDVHNGLELKVDKDNNTIDKEWDSKTIKPNGLFDEYLKLKKIVVSASDAISEDELVPQGLEAKIPKLLDESYKINSEPLDVDISNGEDAESIYEQQMSNNEEENFESIDQELESLLSGKQDIPNEKRDLSPEPMDIDSSMKEKPFIQITTIEHPASILSKLQNNVDRADSDSDSSESNITSDCPAITMHSPISLNDLDDSSNFGDGFLEDKTVGERVVLNQTNEEGLEKNDESFVLIKHIRISANSNVFKEDIGSVKGNKRESDQEESNEHKKLKLDEEGPQILTNGIKNKLEVSSDANVNKKFKASTLESDEEVSNDSIESNESTHSVKSNESAHSDKSNKSFHSVKSNETAHSVESNQSAHSFENNEYSAGVENNESVHSDDSNDSGQSNDSNESADENEELMNGGSLTKLKMMKNKIIQQKLTEMYAENKEEIVNGRKKLFSNYFDGKVDITIDRCMLEEMIMTQIIEYMAYKCDIGQLRQKCRILESEQTRMNQMVFGLKKQAESAQLIIKKLIDEKIKKSSWTQNVMPLKVTRSVGLQVCSCGSMTVRSKFFDKERRSTRIEKNFNKESVTSSHSSLQHNDNVRIKVASSENKENVASSKDSNNDDVVIVSVTENNLSTSSTAVMDNDKNVTFKKILDAAKNRIISNEKVLRKPLSVEHTNGPQIPNKTSLGTSTRKKSVTENLLLMNDLSKTGESDQNVAEIIDLTDKEDHPIRNKLESSSKSPSTLSEQHSIGIKEKVKNATTSHPSINPLIAVNGIKKPPPSSSTAIIKPVIKPVDISAPAADLVNSYDHLPKYPVSPKYPANVSKPPRPILRIGKNTSGKQGIMLSWSFEGGRDPPNIEEYQLYAFQESKTLEKLKSDTWKKVGDIKALPLPMACFLTQFVEGHKYHFIVRAVDTLKRLGDFSLPGSIILHAAGHQPSAS